MHTIKGLIQELQKFPADALAYAYEGEVTGIIIRDSNNKRELGYIPTSASGTVARPTVILPRKGKQ